jgi:hypothetical protein
MASKKQGTSASADSANDAVQVDETVREPQDFKMKQSLRA